jgi:hypothetical protein
MNKCVTYCDIIIFVSVLCYFSDKFVKSTIISVNISHVGSVLEQSKDC